MHLTLTPFVCFEQATIELRTAAEQGTPLDANGDVPTDVKTRIVQMGGDFIAGYCSSLAAAAATGVAAPGVAAATDTTAASASALSPVSAAEFKALPVLALSRLCMTVAFGAYSQAQAPDNEYLSLHAAPGQLALAAASQFGAAEMLAEWQTANSQ
jgi:hypothetical protein